MTYRLAIFDFDGTLADSFPWFVGVFKQVADRHGFSRIHPQDLDSLRTRAHARSWRAWAYRAGSCRWWRAASPA
ncbi:HAD hydrolase-like protein [Pseudomonas sp. NY15437]|uniref:HAD hydrolase-like protein n=1 Tax=Pseudomonas sp. NY15437 TaxID=3400360 RepID=UPI003A87084B